ncbi:hypothetical protein VTK73DRAFT_2529 [Phialemonium thermophilum]|uniref:SUN domain-containing protein n=1 Tax=Phialemonium thermophilum TaxID=223376 RepID=A0ABR3X482_9PEZI
MPPKRRRSVTQDNPGQSEDSPTTRRAVIASRLTPLPARHLTSYGSPAPVLPLPDSGRYGTNLRGATRDIFASVREDNRKARLEHSDSHSGVADVADEPRPSSRNLTPVEEEREEPAMLSTRQAVEVDAPSRARQDDGTSQKPRASSERVDVFRLRRNPPRRLQVAKEVETQTRASERRRALSLERHERLRDLSEESEERVSERPATRASGKRVSEEDGAMSSPKRQRVGETPSNNSDGNRGVAEQLGMSTRSFIEESLVFNQAELATPSASSVAVTAASTIPDLGANLNGRAVEQQTPPPQSWDAPDTLETVQQVESPEQEVASGQSPALSRLEPPSQEALDVETPSKGRRTSRRRQQTTAKQQPTAKRTKTPSKSIVHDPQDAEFMTPATTNLSGTPRRNPFAASSSTQPEHSIPGERRTETAQARQQASRPTGSFAQDGSVEQMVQAERHAPSSRHLHDANLASFWESLSVGNAKRGALKFLGPFANVARWMSYLVFLLLILRFWNRASSAEIEGARLHHSITWHGWKNWRQNIGQFVPYTLQHPLGCISDDEYNALTYWVKTQEGEILKLVDDNKTTRLAIDRLEHIIPRVVSVKRDRKTDRIVIAQEFWLALKEQIQQDKSILTLEPTKGDGSAIPESLWAALVKRFEKQGVPGQKSLGMEDVEHIVEQKMSNSWANWLKGNSKKVEEILGANRGLGSDAENKILSKAEKIIDERLGSKNLKDVVITRDEFVREVGNSIEAYKAEVKGEITLLENRLRDFVKSAVEASRAPSGKAGLSEKEVVVLITDIVRRAVADAQLNAAARGQIGAGLHSELLRRVNYFALGNGATIDLAYSSPTYSAQKGGSFWKLWPKGRLPQFQAAKFAALTAWDDAGHCWCGGTRADDKNTKSVDIAVRLPQSVTPEHLVVEHINPSATLDPDSMPKDMEVWVTIDEGSRRKLAYNLMFASFPDTKADHPLVKLGFIKIGQFTYEYDSAANGVRVFSFSPEYADMAVATDHVLVRAVTNYGSDHTCFYRLRFYGTPEETHAAS